MWLGSMDFIKKIMKTPNRIIFGHFYNDNLKDVLESWNTLWRKITLSINHEYEENSHDNKKYVSISTEKSNEKKHRYTIKLLNDENKTKRKESFDEFKEEYSWKWNEDEELMQYKILWDFLSSLTIQKCEYFQSIRNMRNNVDYNTIPIGKENSHKPNQNCIDRTVLFTDLAKSRFWKDLKVEWLWPHPYFYDKENWYIIDTLKNKMTLFKSRYDYFKFVWNKGFAYKIK